MSFTISINRLSPIFYQNGFTSYFHIFDNGQEKDGIFYRRLKEE